MISWQTYAVLLVPGLGLACELRMLRRSPAWFLLPVAALASVVLAWIHLGWAFTLAAWIAGHLGAILATLSLSRGDQPKQTGGPE